jgi:hypothetical protein
LNRRTEDLNIELFSNSETPQKLDFNLIQ